MLELLGEIALSSSWTGRVDNGQIRVNETKNTGDWNLLYHLQVTFYNSGEGWLTGTAVKNW
jgi:hypothetical protein